MGKKNVSGTVPARASFNNIFLSMFTFFLNKAPPSYTQAKNPYDQANFSGTNQYNNYPTGYEFPPQGQYPGYNNGATDSWQRHDTTDVVRY